MVQKIGQLTGVGTLETFNLFRYEHHKFMIVVSNFVSLPRITINDYTSDNKVNLSPDNNVYDLVAEETYHFLCENQRMDKALIEMVEGDATLDIYYIGW